MNLKRCFPMSELLPDLTKQIVWRYWMLLGTHLPDFPISTLKID